MIAGTYAAKPFLRTSNGAVMMAILPCVWRLEISVARLGKMITYICSNCGCNKEVCGKQATGKQIPLMRSQSKHASASGERDASDKLRNDHTVV